MSVHLQQLSQPDLPQITAEERAKRIKGWNKAVRCSYHWALDEEES